MTKRQGIRAILFVVVLAAVLWWIDDIYRFQPNAANLHTIRRFDELYSDTKDTWDGILVGTSNVDRAWAAPAAYEVYGMTVYPLSTDGGPFFLSTTVIEEALKYQDLSFVVVDLHGVKDENLISNPVKVRRVLDNMKRSGNWLKAVDKSIKYLQTYCADNMDSDATTLRWSYYLPILKYHSRLMSDGITWADIFKGSTNMKGVYQANQHRKTNRIHLIGNTDYHEASDLQKELLDEIIDCCEEHDLQLIFVNVPTELPEDEQESINSAAHYVEEKGYKVLNFNDGDLLEDSDMNGDEDFFDTNHMNTKGARKFTEYFAGWLSENVEGLTDHRGDERYASWDEAVQNYEAFYEKSLKQIAKWLEKHPLEDSSEVDEDAEDTDD